VVAAIGLLPWLRTRTTGVWAFVAVWAAAAAGLFATPGLPGLEPSPLAIGMSMAALVPPVWLSLLDLAQEAEEPAPVWPDSGPLLDFVSCSVAAFVVSASHALLALSARQPVASWSLGFLRSVVSHLLVFCGLFALISVIRGAGRLVDRREIVESWLAR